MWSSGSRADEGCGSALQSGSHVVVDVVDVLDVADIVDVGDADGRVCWHCRWLARSCTYTLAAKRRNECSIVMMDGMGFHDLPLSRKTSHEDVQVWGACLPMQSQVGAFVYHFSIIETAIGCV